MTIFSRSNDDFEFEILYGNNYFKIIGLIYSISVFIITIPPLYFVIIFENENPYKTLQSKILVLFLSNAMAYCFFVQIPDYCIYIFGPLPALICYFEMFFRVCITIQQLFLSDVTMIAKYLFLFNIKNFTSTQHEFWPFYFSLVSFGIGLISTAAFMFLPGNNPNYFYICVGKIPRNHQNGKTKVNILLNYLIFATTLIHVVLGTKIKIFEKKQANSLINNTAPQIASCIIPSIYNMYTLTSQLLALAAVLIFYIPAIIILIDDPKSFESYPGYIWVYIFHLFCTQTIAIVAIVLLFRKNTPLQNYVRKRLLLLFKLQTN